MAKRRRARAKTVVRKVYAKAKRSYKRYTSSKVKAVQFDSMAYGALRGRVASAIEPYSSKIPIVGALTDELGMGLLSWAAAKKGSGMLKQIGLKGLVVENARVGEYAGDMIFSKIGNSSNVSTDGFVYG